MSDQVKSRLASRLEGVSESATLKLNAAVQALKSKGVDVINFTAGEPDFPVPAICKVAAKDAVDKDRSRYTPVAGIPELREKIAARTNELQPSVAKKQPWKSSHVLVSNGAKHSLYNALQCLVDPGDEVIIPAPYWLSYPEMVKLAGGKAVILETRRDEGYRLHPDQLARAIGPKTKALILNSPSNPTGALYGRATFEKLGKAIADKTSAGATKGLFILSDEIYDRLTYTDIPFCSFLEANPALRDWTLTIDGLSKSAAMTGWRVGWSVAIEPITQAMTTLQGQSTSGINSVAQWASLAAFDLRAGDYSEMIGKFFRRRKLVLEMLSRSSKLDVVAPDGAFYFFIGVKKALRPGEDSLAFCERLVLEAQVALVPGGPFGDPESVRMSFATDERQLEEGCRRLVQYLEKN